MRAAAEIYRGIEFVRISILPEDQRAAIHRSIPTDKIIKILKDNSLLKDCVLYSDYIEWLDKTTDNVVNVHRNSETEAILKSA